ncbi:hypothetical protein FLP10_05620 [Agromyces intestinalis]|uniref:Nuclear transport factor 2 family protein n=1 Tax=Agromyces intestinalis TaxID=2592652 RepID=A0A5C1YG39_9MICO|nr:nuclear transport factor 2 family protein [Agromyces intestinalis]QEO13957.1 hypothetical protein FLP10_05620 [Agromyces intestinalis]
MTTTAPTDTESGAETGAETVSRRWTELWNGQLPATELVTADARVEFGRTQPVPDWETTVGPAELQAVIDGIRARFPDVVYSLPTSPIPAADGRLTLLWDVGSEAGGFHRTGIDLLVVREGRVVSGRSVTGDHALHPLG